MRNKKEVLIKCAPRFNQHFLKYSAYKTIYCSQKILQVTGLTQDEVEKL